MKTDITEMLICPACLPEEHALATKVNRQDRNDIIDGELVCEACRKTYPIQDGIGFLDSINPADKQPGNRYETSPVVSSYLWSHYGDLLKDPEASDAYTQWVELMNRNSGFCLDIGSAVGRFTFEMSTKSDFVVGIDNSVSFIRSARDLMVNHCKEVSLVQEGLITSLEMLKLPETWDTQKVEFLVADAQALPFRSRAFSALGSLNMLDKVPVPMKHLTEMNRVAIEQGAQFLCSDPYSWSTEAAKEEDWLGGKVNGSYSGHGIDNLIALLEGDEGPLHPGWTVEQRGHVWWKIRTHRNHFELIRSCFVRAER
jgi:SAM-dependent methyltransferase